MVRLVAIGTLALAAVLVRGGVGFGDEAPTLPEAPGGDRPINRFSKDVVPFLTKHCFACHGNGKRKGDLALDGYRDDQAVQKGRDVWENVLAMVRDGEMPPKGRPKPSAAETDFALQAIDAVLGQVDCSGPGDAGHVTLRRLNRAEYNNTIRDLVGVDFKPAADFPADDVGYGFDNIGDVLSLSPLLLERYLSAAESILDQAIVNVDAAKPAKSRLEGVRASRRAGGVKPSGGFYLHSLGSISGDSYFDEGDYIVRVEAYAEQYSDENVRGSLRIAGEVVKEFEVSSTDASNPETIEAKVRLKPGTSRVAVGFLNPTYDSTITDPEKRPRRLYVRRITVEGPFNAPAPVLPESHKRIMASRPGLAPREAAREIVTRFANRALRRPARPEDIAQALALYDRAEKEGERFEGCVRLALERILVSPNFLFRVELDPSGAKAGHSYPIDEYEVASRLSYFLWSSMPDDELFDLAARGKLRADLERQVQRMLRDPKSAAFVENFAGQWLTIRNLAKATPDPKLFPEFDEPLRAAMYRETELFFDAIVRENRSILDLLDADFSFMNERLARHYGISGVKGEEFRRVKLPANRGGVLTHASILTLTSNPTRTAPVKRGKWILEQILNAPPPPPPPEVPALDDQKELTGSLRQVMEAHRANAICASCHQRMDPLGFAFENYDAIGSWRDKDGKFPVDPSGELPGGRSFKGPAELKAILKGKKELFGRCLAEKMLTYALGRGVESFDRCAVDGILKAMARDNYRFSTLVVEVTRSEPFQMRTATGVQP